MSENNEVTLETPLGQTVNYPPEKLLLCNAEDAQEAGVSFDRGDISEGKIWLKASEFPYGQTIHTYTDGWCVSLTRIGKESWHSSLNRPK
jgi:hypothetical protein